LALFERDLEAYPVLAEKLEGLLQWPGLATGWSVRRSFEEKTQSPSGVDAGLNCKSFGWLHMYWLFEAWAPLSFMGRGRSPLPSQGRHALDAFVIYKYNLSFLHAQLCRRWYTPPWSVRTGCPTPHDGCWASPATSCFSLFFYVFLHFCWFFSSFFYVF
jgi:hypothetical protein